MKKCIIYVSVTVVFVMLAISACKKPDIPSDFTFSLTWGSYGNSSYDSVTGKLVKTTSATNPEDYVTTLLLDSEQKELIRAALQTLDFSQYPTLYNLNEGFVSSVPITFDLAVQYGDTRHIITCKDIVDPYKSDEKKGQLFLTACNAIIDVIVSTDEWKALPEFEFIYA